MSFFDILKKIFFGEEDVPPQDIEASEVTSSEESNISELADGSKLFVPPTLKK